MSYSNVLLIDNQLSDYQVFVDSVNANTYPIVYSSNSSKQDILAQLSQFTKIDRIGIANEKYSLFLDHKLLYVEENIQWLITLIQTFQVARIDFLACNTLTHYQWTEMYERLHNDTGVIVGASDDNTGNLKYGGDWVMESTSEDIELVYFTQTIEYYKHVLNSSADCILVIRTDGFLWGVGINTTGQLGDGTNINRGSFVKITLPRTPKLVSQGMTQSAVLMTDGTLWTTGDNWAGQLGLGHNTNQNTFQQVTLGGGRTIKSVSCGADFIIVNMTDGTVWGVGANYTGQLGIGNNTNQNVFQQMPLPNGLLADSVVCGFQNTMVIMTDGTVWCTGDNPNGQFGVGNKVAYNTLVQAGISQVKLLGSGTITAIVGLTNNTLYGAGKLARLGMNLQNGDTFSFYQITPNISGRIPKYISSGYEHTIILMTDDTLWGTGMNSEGTLGIGNYTDQLAFVQITQNISGKTPQYIMASGMHTVVMMTDGTMWVTGRNLDRRLGYVGDDFPNTLRQVLTDVMVIPGYMANITAPTAVSNVSPTVGTTNTLVTLTGTSLANTASVLFGTVPGTNLQVTGTSVQVSAPANSGSVSIVVRDTSGNDVSAGNFTYQNPTVVSMPSSGAPQSPIVITGTFLNTISSVRFGTTSATFTALAASITATVPLGSGTVTVSMSDTAGNTYTAGNFQYRVPTLTGMNPTTAYANDTVVLSGSNLGNTSFVSFGTVVANTFTSSANSITVTVPSNTGSVSVSATDIYGNVATVSGNFVYLVSSGQTPTPNPTPNPTPTPNQNPNQNPTPDFTPSYNSSICFPSGTLVHTDHGQVPIQKLIPGKHTLRGKPIVAVPETYSMDHLLVCVEKDALRKNSPCVQTVISPRHKIYHKGKLRAAFRFVGKHKGFSFVPYQGEKLYNVLLAEYGTMNVQGMICETLHPSNPVAKLYTKNMALQ